MKPIRICIVEDLKEVREGVASLLTLDERFEMLKAFSVAGNVIATFLSEFLLYGCPGRKFYFTL